MKTIRILMMIMTLLTSSIYPTTMTVTKVEQGFATFTTHDGHEYTLPQDEAWKVGDPAAAIMATRGTKTKDDDRILQIRYTGWRH